MLEMIGLGSAFHTKLGNTSAYIKENQTMLLIDCGGTVFHKLKELNALKDIKQLNIIITHTHPDHIGSLGDLIFYAYFILKIQPIIYYPDKQLLQIFLTCVGVEEKMVTLTNQIHNHLYLTTSRHIHIQFIPVTHLSTVQSYAIKLTISGIDPTTIYYSGDSNMIPCDILSQFKNHEIDYLYQDTCGLDYDGNPHLSIQKLTNLIPSNHRKRVFCIHLDEHLDLNQVKHLGFQIPKV